MAEHRLPAENVSVQVASQANALPLLKGKYDTPIFFSAVAPIEADRFENGVKASGVKRSSYDVADRVVSGKSTSTETA